MTSGPVLGWYPQAMETFLLTSAAVYLTVQLFRVSRTKIMLVGVALWLRRALLESP